MSENLRPWTAVQPPTKPPAGAYSPGVWAGDFFFVSGQVPRDPDTGELAGEDIESQVRATMTNLKHVLAAAELGLHHLVSVVVYLADESDWPTFDRVYREFMQPPFPTRTAVGARLRGIRVEITATAYAPR